MKWVQLHGKPLDCVSAGEPAVPEFHRSPLLLSATSHLLLSGTGLSHDAAGETPTVFRLEVWTQVSNAQSCVPQNEHGDSSKANSVEGRNENQFQLATWPIVTPPPADA